MGVKTGQWCVDQERCGGNNREVLIRRGLWVKTGQC